jgi:hypothetical protein
MRSVNRIGCIAALALAGCGNYSTEDLRFLAALPTRGDLRVRVPVAATASQSLSQATAACPFGTATVWLQGKPASDGFNAGVDQVLALVDSVRRATPTHRSADRREWGPFDDEKHPGIEIIVVMQRWWPDDPGAPPQHQYGFAARPKGTSWWTPVLTGTFVGASASAGSGSVTLDFDAVHALGMNDAGTPHGTMPIQYDRSTDPSTIDLLLLQGGFGLVGFAYGYAGYADGNGRFDYAFLGATGDLLKVTAGFDPAGAGRAEVSYRTALGLTGGFKQCWDAGACLVYVDDPGNYSGACGAPPCMVGALSDCPSVRAAPF